MHAKRLEVDGSTTISMPHAQIVLSMRRAAEGVLRDGTKHKCTLHCDPMKERQQGQESSRVRLSQVAHVV